MLKLLWKYLHLSCRSMRARAAQKPGWSKSLTFSRWSCRLMSTRNWRGSQEDCRSSLTPPMVSLICFFMFRSILWQHFTSGIDHICLFQSSLSSSHPSQVVFTTRMSWSSSALSTSLEKVTRQKRKTQPTRRRKACHRHHRQLHRDVIPPTR